MASYNHLFWILPHLPYDDGKEINYYKLTKMKRKGDRGQHVMKGETEKQKQKAETCRQRSPVETKDSFCKTAVSFPNQRLQRPLKSGVKDGLENRKIERCGEHIIQ